MEVVSYSKICRQDLDLGTGRREIRLADGALHTLDQINLGALWIPEYAQITPGNGLSSVTVSFSNPAGAYVAATVKVLSALGAANGLTAIDVGDAVLADRWGGGIAITQDTETSSADFTDNELTRVNAGYSVVITARAGTFDGTGELEVCLQYWCITHPGH